MPSISSKIKPASGFSYIVHLFLTALLPALVFVFVRLGFIELAVALILLSKWRMFAVKPRHWPANIRANAVDLIAGLSFLTFMVHSDSQSIQLVWAAIYGVWLVAIKPSSNPLGVFAQAFISMVVGLIALFLQWGDAPIYFLVVAGWVICYSAARHFFASFDEPLTRFLSNVWGLFGASMIWILGHWLLFYGVVAQPALLLSVMGFSLGAIYYLDQTDKLSVPIRRQLVFVMIAIIMIVLVASNWGDRTI
jgi:hypothetical protein